MFDKNLAIVDIETTGMSASYNRIIEIAIIRVERNRIVDKFTTLVNPKMHISPFIVNFTGISPDDLKNAPVFEEVKDRVIKLLTNATFVAHNVRFDYSFIKSELRRIGIPFKSKTCCTVKLSRRLFPRYRSHSLESVIERFDFSFKNRHRAYDDAYVLWQFLKKIKKTFPREKLISTWTSLTKSLHSADPVISRQVDALPESPGAYFFYNKKNKLLYVGKSNNISDRVISHFSEDNQSTKHLFLIKEIGRIDFVETPGELGAMLSESRFIKELHPIYNRRLQEKNVAIVSKKLFNKKGLLTFDGEMNSTHNFEKLDDVFRIFNNKRSMKEYLSEFAEKYSLCKKLLGLESGHGSCFAYKLGKCKGACIGKEKKPVYNARFLVAFIENKQFKKWPFADAIEITEKNEEDKWERYRFDNWQLLKRETSAGDKETYNPRFDADIYTILLRYFKRSKGYNIKKI